MSATAGSDVFITPEEAIALLRNATIGRIAFTERGLPAVQPVNFVVVNNDVIVRTAPGSKLDTALRHAVVAFEVDEIDTAQHTGWSVTVVGYSGIVSDPTELARLGAAWLRARAEGGDSHFIRIEIELIHGRRIE